MKRAFLFIVFVSLFSCVHTDEAVIVQPQAHVTQVNQVTPVTVVQQTTVNQTVPVTVNYGRPLDCDMMCGATRRSCNQSCVPTSWSSNMRSIQDSCEGNCRFSEYVCVGDCVRSGGSSRTR